MFRIVAGFVIAAVAVQSAPAQTKDAVAEVLACRSIEDDAQRLACLDEAAAGLAAAVSGAQASAAPAEDPAATFGFNRQEPVRTEDEFGAEDLPKQAAAPVEKEEEGRDIRELRARVLESGANPFGKAILVLENGQVWRQLDSDNVRLRIPRGVAATAIIKKSALGGYRMTVEPLGRTIRVRRVK
ncbi:MAG: hypothetical protein Kow00133_21470 [Amphiplicatus sp.]